MHAILRLTQTHTLRLGESRIDKGQWRQFRQCRPEQELTAHPHEAARYIMRMHMCMHMYMHMHMCLCIFMHMCSGGYEGCCAQQMRSTGRTDLQASPLRTVPAAAVLTGSRRRP